MAGKAHVLLPQRQPFAGGDAQLQFDEIEPGDRFGHGMLDLQARIHLQKIERAGRIEQKFERARALVADRLDGGDRERAHARSKLARNGRGRRFLDQLLVAALRRAVAFAEMDGLAPAVGENLDFDMARRFDRALEQHRRRRRTRPAPRTWRRAEGGRSAASLGREAHAAPAAAGERLDHHGKADLARRGCERRLALVAVVAGNAGNAGRAHQRLGARLVAHGADRGGRRADEDEPGRLAGRGEGGVLGEEAVAGMDRVGAARLRRRRGSRRC